MVLCDMGDKELVDKFLTRRQWRPSADAQRVLNAVTQIQEDRRAAWESLLHVVYAFPNEEAEDNINFNLRQTEQHMESSSLAEYSPPMSLDTSIEIDGTTDEKNDSFKDARLARNGFDLYRQNEADNIESLFQESLEGGVDKATGNDSAERVAMEGVTSGNLTENIATGSLLTEKNATEGGAAGSFLAESIATGGVTAGSLTGSLATRKVAVGSFLTERNTTGVTRESFLTESIATGKVAAGNVLTESIATGSLLKERVATGVTGKSFLAEGIATEKNTAGGLTDSIAIGSLLPESLATRSILTEEGIEAESIPEKATARNILKEGIANELFAAKAVSTGGIAARTVGTDGTVVESIGTEGIAAESGLNESGCFTLIDDDWFDQVFGTKESDENKTSECSIDQRCGNGKEPIYYKETNKITTQENENNQEASYGNNKSKEADYVNESKKEPSYGIKSSKDSKNVVGHIQILRIRQEANNEPIRDTEKNIEPSTDNKNNKESSADNEYNKEPSTSNNNNKEPSANNEYEKEPSSGYKNNKEPSATNEYDKESSSSNKNNKNPSTGNEYNKESSTSNKNNKESSTDNECNKEPSNNNEAPSSSNESTTELRNGSGNGKESNNNDIKTNRKSSTGYEPNNDNENKESSIGNENVKRQSQGSVISQKQAQRSNSLKFSFKTVKLQGRSEEQEKQGGKLIQQSDHMYPTDTQIRVDRKEQSGTYQNPQVKQKSVSVPSKRPASAYPNKVKLPKTSFSEHVSDKDFCIPVSKIDVPSSKGDSPFNNATVKSNNYKKMETKVDSATIPSRYKMKPVNFGDFEVNRSGIFGNKRHKSAGGRLSVNRPDSVRKYDQEELKVCSSTPSENKQVEQAVTDCNEQRKLENAKSQDYKFSQTSVDSIACTPLSKRKSKFMIPLKTTEQEDVIGKKELHKSKIAFENTLVKSKQHRGKLVFQPPAQRLKTFSRNATVEPSSTDIQRRNVVRELIKVTAHHQLEELEAFIANCSRLSVTLVYRNNMNQMREFAGAQPTPPKALSLCVTRGLTTTFYHLPFKKHKKQDLRAFFLGMFTSSFKTVCFDAQELILYIVERFELEEESAFQWQFHDPKIGCWLLDPENAVLTFANSLQLLGMDKLPAQANLIEDLLSLNEAMENLTCLLKEAKLWDLFENIEMKLTPVLAVMALHEFKIDVEWMHEQRKLIQSQVCELEQACWKEAGGKFNVDSIHQLRKVLYTDLKLDEHNNVNVGRTNVTNNKSTSAVQLQQLGKFHPLPGLILKYRQLSTVKSSFIDGFLEYVHNGALQFNWKQTAASTGRISSSKPNIQGFPKTWLHLNDSSKQVNIRDGFLAKEGHTLVAADFEQMELRLFAHLCGDENMARSFDNREHDVFVHLTTQWKGIPYTDVTQDERHKTKQVVYASIYGAGKAKLAEVLGISESQAQVVLASFRESYPQVQKFHQQTVKDAKTSGETRSIMNRRRRFPHINSTNVRLRLHAERQAVNFRIQGTAADICKAAMIETSHALKGYEALLLLQIHDELVWEVPDEHVQQVSDIIRKTMEDTGVLCRYQLKLNVPLTVRIKTGKKWSKLN